MNTSDIEDYDITLDENDGTLDDISITDTEKKENDRLPELVDKLKIEVDNLHDEIASIDNSGTKASLICCSTLCVLILICCSLLYTVFGIIFLVHDYNIVKDCKNSNLWAYVLVSMILGLSSSSIRRGDGNEPLVNAAVFLICGFINLGFAIWGGIELFEKSCHDVKSSDLWTFACFTFGLQIFVCFLCFIVFPIGAYFVHSLK
jgi:hypothetical protein